MGLLGSHRSPDLLDLLDLRDLLDLLVLQLAACLLGNRDLVVVVVVLRIGLVGVVVHRMDRSLSVVVLVAMKATPVGHRLLLLLLELPNLEHCLA